MKKIEPNPHIVEVAIVVVSLVLVVAMVIAGIPRTRKEEKPIGVPQAPVFVGYTSRLEEEGDDK